MKLRRLFRLGCSLAAGAIVQAEDGSPAHTFTLFSGTVAHTLSRVAAGPQTLVTTYYQIEGAWRFTPRLALEFEAEGGQVIGNNHAESLSLGLGSAYRLNDLQENPKLFVPNLFLSGRAAGGTVRWKAGRLGLQSSFDDNRVAQFEQWRKAGVVANYLILFSHFANAQLEDMWVILDFAKFSDVAQWLAIERHSPGGLSPEALALATPKTCVYTDKGWAGGTPNPEPGKSVYMMIPYQTLVPADEYADFVSRYVEPQLKFWVKSGIMHTYAVHIEQNPTNTPWDSLLVFEYDGLRGIALRDVVKQQVRDSKLKDDPGYKHFSPIKRTIRKELQPTTFDPILPTK